jgi:hypothetical protein
MTIYIVEFVYAFLQNDKKLYRRHVMPHAAFRCIWRLISEQSYNCYFIYHDEH